MLKPGPGISKKVLEASVSSIVREVDNLNDLLVEFREFARLPMPRLQSVQLRELVDEVVAMYTDLSAEVLFDSSHISSGQRNPRRSRSNQTGTGQSHS